jgi:2-polyprenyl-3-methyl-5-hydroxy-6-metoxy-1,4-benzoquinol methylase
MPGYQVKHETLLLGGHDFVIRSLLDNLQYSDPKGDAAEAGISEAGWPLFGLVWPSARILAEAMASQDLAGRRILEIGCGLGLASLVAHRREGDVTASDRHPLTQSFLDRNTALNDLPPMAYRTGNWGRTNPDLGRFDLIIASDVLYERHQPDILASFVANHANPDAEIVIVDPNRGQRVAFCRSMESLGFGHDVRAAAKKQNSGEAYSGHVLTFARDR